MSYYVYWLPGFASSVTRYPRDSEFWELVRCYYRNTLNKADKCIHNSSIVIISFSLASFRKMFKNQIQTVTQFVQRALKLEREHDEKIFFRGRPNSFHNNTPSVLRAESLRTSEHFLLRDLISLHPEHFLADKAALEQLVRAQHYGLPTRLLDITSNPLAAIFFACDGQRDEDAEIDVFFVKET